MIDSSPRRVLVTGASGFVGGAVVRRLLSDGHHQVRAVVRAPGGALQIDVDTMVIPDLGAPDTWEADFSDVSVIVHCAARTHATSRSVRDPLEELRRVNVLGTLHLARRAAEQGVRRFVFLSSIKVHGETTMPGRPFRVEDTPSPEDAYAISKRQAEEGLLALGRQTGMEVTIIRPPLVYGPGVRGNFASLMAWVARGIPLPLGSVRYNRRSLVALDNLIDLIVTCVDHPEAANDLFLVGDGEDLSTADLLRRVGQAIGRPARLVPVPTPVLRAVAALSGRRDLWRRLCGSLQVDISHTRDRLAWRPPLTVEEGLRRAVGPPVRPAQAG